MRQLTTSEFQTEIELDPAWASKLTEPVEITDFCDMTGSKITHLSPLLHFTGGHNGSNTANFTGCLALKVAEGTFSSFVQFDNSGVERIGGLRILKGNRDNNAASFSDCKHLKVAEGTFPGLVYFNRSGIEKIGELHITAPGTNGHAAWFIGCENLKIAEGSFPGAVDFRKSGVEKVGRLSVTTANNAGFKLSLSECHNLRHLPKEWRESNAIGMDSITYAKIQGLQAQRDAVAKMQKTAEALEI